MLTSYLVHCPHFKCDWTGELIPSAEFPSGRLEPMTSTVVFECPLCQQEWSARVTDNQVEPLRIYERDTLVFPPLELGIGD